jgi:hypothetical protein
MMKKLAEWWMFATSKAPNFYFQPRTILLPCVPIDVCPAISY